MFPLNKVVLLNKLTAMKKIITLAAILICITIAKAQRDTVTIFFAGYTNQCCAANTTPYFCFNDGTGGTANCGNGTSYSAQAFMNPVPVGNVVTKVDVFYYTLNCGGTGAATVNGVPLSTASVLAGGCLCANDTVGWSATASSSNIYPCGIPGYNYATGASENLLINFVGAVCISQARIVLTYTTAPAGTTPPVGITASQDSVCSNTTVTLTASGASTYTWNTGSTASTITVAPANSTTYNVIGTDATGGCINMAMQPIYVESITINATQNIVCGSPASVTLTASGANTYTWNTGNITNTISATPTVTTTYTVNGTGSMAGCTSLSAIETVTVSSNPIPITSFTLTPDTTPHYWDAYAGYPPNVTNASWSWGDGTSTIGLYPSHIYAAPGSYNVCVTVTVTTGCSVSYCQSDSVYRLVNNSVYSSMVYVNVLPPHNQTTSINKVTSKNKQVNIYPNPNSGSFVIETNAATKQTIQVYDITGKMVLIQTVNGKTNIDASVLDEGVYNISISSSEGVVNKRIVIIK